MNVIDYCRQMIRSGDLDQISEVINMIPVDDFDMDEADEVFLDIAEALLDNDVPEDVNKEVGDLLYSRFAVGFISKISYLSKLSVLPDISIPLLTFLADATELTYDQLIAELLESEDKDFVGQGITNLIEVFGDVITDEELNRLWKHADTAKNMWGKMAIGEEITRRTEAAEKPEWIVSTFVRRNESLKKSNGEEDEALPTEEELYDQLPDPSSVKPYTLPSDLEIAMMISENLIRSGVVISVPKQEGDDEVPKSTQIIDDLARKIGELEQSKKEALYRPIAYQLSQGLKEHDDLMTRYLGPANPQYGETFSDPDSPCSKYGGCRMLTCTHEVPYGDLDLKLDNPIPMSEREWFTGVCEICRKEIKKSCYAFRIPLEFGGWSYENFCSPEHARLHPSLKRPEQGELISIFGKILLQKGIEDRD